MNVILERKDPYIKPYKGYNQYNNRRLHYLISSVELHKGLYHNRIIWNIPTISTITTTTQEKQERGK